MLKLVQQRPKQLEADWTVEDLKRWLAEYDQWKEQRQELAREVAA